MLTKLKFKYNIRLTNKIIFWIKRFKSILRFKFTKEIVKLKKVKSKKLKKILKLLKWNRIKNNQNNNKLSRISKR